MSNMIDKKIIETYPFNPSTIENIDGALLDWLDEKMNINIVSNQGWNKVPVIWVAGERSFQTKHNKELRDINGSLILPLITLERKGLNKSLSRKGIYFGDAQEVQDYESKGGVVEVANIIKQDKTANFTNAYSKFRTDHDNERGAIEKTVYQIATIPLPVYIEIDYEISLRSEYQQQMNQMLTPFINLGRAINYFVVSRDGHRYECFLQGELGIDNNISEMTEEQRNYETVVNIKTLGYIVGSGDNENKPMITVRESAPILRIQRERSIVGDIPEHVENGKYRE
jgi:hypothetical protein